MGMTLEELQAEGAKPHGMTLEQLKAEGGREHRAPAVDKKTGLPLVSPQLEARSREGLETGPIESARLPGTALSVPLRPDMSEIEFDQLADRHGENVQRIENALGGGAAGGVLGMAGRGVAAGAEGGRLAAAADVLRKGVQNSFLHGGNTGIAVNALSALFPGLGAAASNAAGSAVVGGLGAGGAVGGDMAAPTETQMQRAVRLLLGQPPQFPQGE